MRRKISLKAVVWATILLVLLAGVTKIVWDQQFSSAYAWTRNAVEATYPPPPTSTFSIQVFDLGWDRQVRFYAAFDPKSSVILVDRLSGRTCDLGTTTSASVGEWKYANFLTAVTYDLWVRNQYGLDVRNQLDLTTWQLTVTEYGICEQWTMCTRLDPPRVTTRDCTQ